ncbi:hypothetical protein SAMN05216521_106911 [Enterocloster clostridioformis]|uniref:Uncharacterized protein n=1 Tax=Enterocloster clostridioformis TaxID=1531 RepID=A0A1I0JUY3_9FIRM|nr:hypothetical protein SAMN05216521_106911 [Enterocloster clostridioformis]SEW47337.1 hypothetical protein SAMN05216528_106511 [Enterocloster clostridioformis]
MLVLTLISILSCKVFYNPIFAVRCGGIILAHVYAIIVYPVIGIAGSRLNIAFHEQVTIRAEAIVLSGNGFPRSNRIFVTLFHISPSIIIVVILYPALNIVAVDPSITEMEPKISVNQYTTGGLNYRTCIECFDDGISLGAVLTFTLVPCNSE